MPNAARWKRALPNAREGVDSKLQQRAINSRQYFSFAEDFEKMIEARAEIAAGDGEAGRMHERADFDAEFCGRGFKCRFNFGRIKLLQHAERIANGFEPRLVFGTKMFGDALGVVLEIVGEIEPAIGRQFVERVDLAFASLQRGTDVFVREVVDLDSARAQF